MKTTYGYKTVGDVDVFYREAGPRDAPVLLLLHGFPSASHMFRDLIPRLSGRFRLIAPDLPGFGQTRAPRRGDFDYTFDNLANVVEAFTAAMSLERYALYVFDYGAPVGLRLAMRHPEKVSAIISQNGNAYVEGSATNGGRGKPVGGIPVPPTAKPAGPRSRRIRSATGNTAPAPIRTCCRPMDTSSTSPTWPAPTPRRSSST